MGQSTEELTQGIEETRANLSRDIDELSDKVSPGRVVQRQKEAVKGRLGSVRDSVMGSASSATSSIGGSVQDTAHGALDSAHGVVDSATGAVSSLESRAEGNPLAAGLIAFGAGVLLSSFIPASRAETRVARVAMDAAHDAGQPLLDQAKSIGQDIGDSLKDQAMDAAQELKSSAQDAAAHVKDEAQASASTVKSEATPS